MDAAHSLVDGKLEQALVAIETVERSLQIVLDLCRAEIIETATLKLLQRPHFLLVGIAHIGSEIEVESRNGLTSVHLVLTSLQGDASQYGCRLDALGRTGRSVTCRESVAQDDIERMLHTGERLGGIIVLVVDVEIVVLHSQTRILREQVVVHERLGGLGSKLHHHAGRRVGIHVGILASDVVLLCIDNAHENIAGLSLTGYRALVAIGDILTGHVLARTLHQLTLYLVLDLLHAHLLLAACSDTGADTCHQLLVLTLFGMDHRFADSGLYLFLVESHDTTVAFHHC